MLQAVAYQPKWRNPTIRGSIEQLSEHNRLVDNLKCIIAHAVTSEDFKRLHRLDALTNDALWTCSLTDKRLEIVTPSILTDVTR